MRADAAAFAAKNAALAKRPHYAVEVAFDSANTILRWFTSHADTPLPAGATVIAGVLEGLSGTSQTLNPDTAVATIGAINFRVVDKAGIVTSTLGGQLALGRSTRRQRVRVYVGYEGLAWADFVLVQTQLVAEISWDEGLYTFKCMDVQREMRKDLFDPARTTLSASLTAAATTVNVYDTSAFATVAHGTSYSDAPSTTVGYVKIEEEVIRYTGKTATSFTGCTRGALNTRAVEHAVDANQAADRRTKVEEYVYLEMPAVKLAYALLTGVLHNQGGATLPTAWHLGIPSAFVRLADFTGIGKDLWNPSDDQQGFPLRFEGVEKIDGKKFIEDQIMVLLGAFLPVYADGALGLKRMANILAGAAYVATLDETNIVDGDELVHDFGAMRNVLVIDWNYEPAAKECTRTNVLIDAASVAVHGKADSMRFKFRGLHGSRHSSATLAQRFDAFRDRYTGPPLRTGARVLHRLNTLEVGDVVRLRPGALVRDFVANGNLDRSFEVQNISIDWMTGAVGLKLFGSSQAPGAIAPTSDATVLSDAWWIGTGTALSSVLTITGSNPGHVSASGSLAGNADMTAAGAIYYYLGDLVIDPGVEVTIGNNVQLRVKGNLTNNGKINGKAGGLAGAAAVVTAANDYDYTPGTAGYIGSTEAGGGLLRYWDIDVLESFRGGVVRGANDVVPSLNLAWNGTTLAGIPTDMRGSSGSSGMPLTWMETGSHYEGGAGGKGGAGLLIVCRGFAQGVAGVIDLSGGDGFSGESYTHTVGASDFRHYAGSGAGGAPGALAVLLDGALVTATGLTEAGFVALYGATPIPPGVAAEPTLRGATTNIFGGDFSSYFTGTGDGTTFALPSLSGARGGARVQFVPGNPAAAADLPAGILTAPTNLGLASGTAELLQQSDGTVVPRIKATWTASPDSRTAGYELQFKPSAESVWSDAPIVVGQSAAQAWIVGVRDGVQYDVRLRAGGSARQVSDWVTITAYTVIGKTAAPSNVGTLSFTDPILSWPKTTDLDLGGYIVRYQAGASTDWNSATPAHVEGYITEARYDTSLIVGGQVTLLVKARDTSGNVSASVSSLLVDLRPAAPGSFTVTRQADGTREFAWTLASPPADLEGYKIRYYLGTTADWSAMTALHNGVLKASPFESNQLAAGTWTFAIKSVDWAGNESAAATFITGVALGDPRVAGSIEDLKEEPDWTGTKTSCVVDSGTGWLIASDPTTTWATLPATWDGWTSWTNAPSSPITYQRNIDIGLKTKFTPLVTVVADGSQTIEEQHSDDDISYSAWAAVGPQVDARYIRIRVTVTGSFPKMKSMRTILSATPVTEVIEDLVTSTLTGAYRIGVGDIRLPITKSYGKIKAITVMLQGVGAGWSVELIDKDTSVGPRIKIYNASNALADATIDAIIEGI